MFSFTTVCNHEFKSICCNHFIIYFSFWRKNDTSTQCHNCSTKRVVFGKIKDIVSFIKPFFKPYCTKMLRSNRKELYCLLLQQLCILKVYLPTSGIESLICSKSKSKYKMDISFYDFLS